MYVRITICKVPPREELETNNSSHKMLRTLRHSYEVRCVPATLSYEVRTRHVCFGAKAGETQDIRKEIQYMGQPMFFFMFLCFLKMSLAAF